MAGYFEFSKSNNAMDAELAGSFPRTRAAKELGLSPTAFDLGVKYDAERARGEVFTGEWHHVSKHYNVVDYFDTVAANDSPWFWLGAARAYKSKSKRAELVKRAREAWKVWREERIAAAERRRFERIAALRERIRRNLAPPPVPTHDSRRNWNRLCEARLGGKWAGAPMPEPGDFAGLEAAIRAIKDREAADAERFETAARLAESLGYRLVKIPGARWAVLKSNGRSTGKRIGGRRPKGKPAQVEAWLRAAAKERRIKT